MTLVDPLPHYHIRECGIHHHFTAASAESDFDQAQTAGFKLVSSSVTFQDDPGETLLAQLQVQVLHLLHQHVLPLALQEAYLQDHHRDVFNMVSGIFHGMQYFKARINCTACCAYRPDIPNLSHILDNTVVRLSPLTYQRK